MAEYVMVFRHDQRTAYAVVEAPRGLVGYVWSYIRLRKQPRDYGNGKIVWQEVVWRYGKTPDDPLPLGGREYYSRREATRALLDRRW